MKCFKMITALCLVLAFGIGILPVAAAGAVATVGQATARPGETVTLSVSVTGFSDVAGIDLHIRYDTTRLECVTARAAGLAKGMEMASVNTTVSGHPDEIWFTAITLGSISGDGDVMELTFRVKDDAPEGVATVALVERDGQLSDVNAASLPLTSVGGGITVVRQDGATTAASQITDAMTTPPALQTQIGQVTTTTAPTAANTTAAPIAVVTKPNGDEIHLPEPEQATDINGNTLTNEDGDPLYVQGVAVTVDEIEAKPGETVTVRVAVSAVTDLTTLVLQLEYDPEALEYVSGETTGFLKEAMAWSAVSKDADGALSIGATDATGVSGEGVIATMQFKVKATADARDYRLSLRSGCEMQAGDIDVPLYLYSGEVRVMGENRNIVTPIVVVSVLVFIAALTAALAMVATRKKTKKSVEE